MRNDIKGPRTRKVENHYPNVTCELAGERELAVHVLRERYKDMFI